MGLIEMIFPKKKKEVTVKETFKILDGYVPVFRDWNGAIYESEFVKTAIDAVARHISKLSVVIEAGTQSELITRLKKSPNQYSTWSQFLYRLATILNVKNTAFIIPLRDKFGTTVGIYPICPIEWELVRAGEELWLRFKFKKGDTFAEKLSDVGILTRYQFESEFFGSDNKALDDTMNLIHIQRQGIEEYTKNASSYRFTAQLKNFSSPEDLKKERERFDVENFQGKSGGGILLFPNTYADVKQITSQSYAVDTEQLKLIERNVFDYFGVNEDVIQNKAYGDLFTAFYEGAIEPLAIQLSEVLTKMLFTPTQIAFGSGIYFTANRIQYMTNADKLAVTKDLTDRGILSINEAREIWQLTPIDGGDRHILRGEYYDTSTGTKVEEIGDSTDNEE